jgi:effector-binding domain-containing protein
MIDSPEITRTQPQTAAVIHVRIPRDQIQRVMAPAINELMAALSDQGVRQVGPLFAHHLALSSDTFDLEVGFPASVAVAPVGRVKPGELPARRVARTVYRGSYEGLFSAWAAFDKWMEEQNLRPGETLWERYLAGPESNPDPSTWRTELNRPLLEVAP